MRLCVPHDLRLIFPTVSAGSLRSCVFCLNHQHAKLKCCERRISAKSRQLISTRLVSLAACLIFSVNHLDCRRALAANPTHQLLPAEVVEVAGLLGLLGVGEELEDKIPIDPFTLQGVTEKKYRIEELEGEKVVKRRQGVTVKTCIKVASTAQSGGTGVLEAPKESVCSSAEDRSSVKKACQVSCQTACSESLENYRTGTGSALGISPSRQDLERPTKKCARNCAYECQKEGSGYSFTVNSTS